MTLDGRVPGGPIDSKWSRHKGEMSLVNPSNRRKYDVIVVGTGLAGASAAATLGEQGYKGEGAIPDIPVDVRCEAARRYIEAYEQISGRAFDPNTEDPVPRIRRNLGL